MKRVTVYIDGLNFHYGLNRMAAKNTDWQRLFWIDFVTLLKHFTPHDNLEKVIFFTTKPINIQKNIRQNLLLKANRILNGKHFEVKLGKYKDKAYTCPNCNHR